MTQERALHTRHRLLQTAAVEFSRHGYAGTSLARICTGAEVTMGALTFHFASKRELADAVCTQGQGTTRAAVMSTAASRGPSRLQAIIDSTHVIALLLTDNASVQAVSRLCNEGLLAQHSWYDVWLPTVRSLAVKAGESGELQPHTTADDVTLLAACLIAGVQTTAVQAAVAEPRRTTIHKQLSQFWSIVLSFVAAPAQQETLRPDGPKRSS